MKPAMIPRPGMMQKQQAMAYHAAAQAQANAQAHAQAHAHAQAQAAAASSSATSQPGSLTHRSGAWQSTLSGGAEGGREGRSGMRGPQLVIPRAKVKPRSNYQSGYNSDEDRVSEVSNSRKSI